MRGSTDSRGTAERKRPAGVRMNDEKVHMFHRRARVPASGGGDGGGLPGRGRGGSVWTAALPAAPRNPRAEPPQQVRMAQPNTVVRPYGRSGAWTTAHADYRRAAAGALWQLRRLAAAHDREHDALAARGDPPGWVFHQLRGMREHAWALATAVEIYAAMSVEAFLNFYGVVRLGETFYRDNLQRVGVTEKLTLLLAMCDGVELERDSELWRTVRGLFDRRNALVHPKARELPGYGEDGTPPPAPAQATSPVERATAAYRQMRTFYRGFPEYAPEVGPRGARVPGPPEPGWWPEGDLQPPAALLQIPHP